MHAHGAELIGEMRYADTYRLAYIRETQGIIVGLAEQLGQGHWLRPVDDRRKGRRRPWLLVSVQNTHACNLTAIAAAPMFILNQLSFSVAAIR